MENGSQLEQVRLNLIQCLDPLSIFEVLFQLDMVA
jgi:hypothetical protein